jgi:kynurenine formamidase
VTDDRRVEFDFEVEFLNGGGLQGQGFRLDIDGEDITDEQLATYVVEDLRLLMVGAVRIANKRILREPHKRSARVAGRSADGRARIDLSHDVEDGMGTYVESPFHRFADGADLSELPLERLVDLDAVRVDVTGARDRAIGRGALAAYDVAGRAVLVHTDWARHWRTDAYFEGHPFLTADAAEHLVERGAALVGIDSLNIDDTADRSRPVHSALLGAEVPIVEHLCNLAALPTTGFRFSAVPAKVARFGSWPVRAYGHVLPAN